MFGILYWLRRAILSIPQYVFIAWYLIKHRDNFALYRTIKKSSDSSVGIALD